MLLKKENYETLKEVAQFSFEECYAGLNTLLYNEPKFVSSTRWQISLPFSFIIVFLFFCITNKPRLCTEQIFFL